MHFFPFNIGDYGIATAHLDEMEDLAYRRLMDLYYSSEKPIPLDMNEVSRRIRMRTHSESIANVLSEFFTQEDDGYHCDRIDMELFKYQEKSDQASKSAKVRWKKHKEKQKLNASCKRIASAYESHSEGNAKQELRTKNEERIIKPIVQPKAKQNKFTEFDLENAKWMSGLIDNLNPNRKKPNFESWAEDIRKMREIDNRSIEEIQRVFSWANSDSFWQSNILSPSKLRSKFDDLVIKSKSSNGKNNLAINTAQIDYQGGDM